jgi:hypothetical protein
MAGVLGSCGRFQTDGGELTDLLGYQLSDPRDPQVQPEQPLYPRDGTINLSRAHLMWQSDMALASFVLCL